MKCANMYKMLDHMVVVKTAYTLIFAAALGLLLVSLGVRQADTRVRLPSVCGSSLLFSNCWN